VTGFFIFGLIGDTKETMQATINFAKSLDLDGVILNIATPYPGTRMWSIISQKKGKILFKNWADFHHVSGKMLYVLPGMATPSEVEAIYRKAYLSILFRPKYIVKQIPRLFSLSFLPVMYRALRRIIYSRMLE